MPGVERSDSPDSQRSAGSLCSTAGTLSSQLGFAQVRIAIKRLLSQSGSHSSELLTRFDDAVSSFEMLFLSILSVPTLQLGHGKLGQNLKVDFQILRSTAIKSAHS